MKFAQVFALQVVVVAIGIAAYHHLRDDGGSTERAAAPRNGAIVAGDLERRIAALEARPRTTPSARVDKSDLEARVARLEAERNAEPSKNDRKPAELEPKRRKPTADDVAWFRAMRAAVRRDDAVKKNRKLVDMALDKLSIRLTAAQRDAVHRARANFESRVDEIWTEIKTDARETEQAGGEVDGAALFRQGQARIQREFAASLSNVIAHSGDAEAVAAVMFPAGGK